MPCRHEGMEGDEIAAKGRELENLRAGSEQREFLDLATRVACTVLGYLDEHEILIPEDSSDWKEVHEWWGKHQEQDKLRRQQEIRREYHEKVKTVLYEIQGAVLRGAAEVYISEAQERLNQLIQQRPPFMRNNPP